MKLSKTATLASLAMAHLARSNRDQLVQARQIAEHLAIPTDSALKILQNLARRGLIHSRLGRGGGYCLRTPPQQVTLLQVIEAIDGPITAELPVITDDLCLQASVDMLTQACSHAAVVVKTELARITIHDLATARSLPHTAVA